MARARVCGGALALGVTLAVLATAATVPRPGEQLWERHYPNASATGVSIGDDRAFVLGARRTHRFPFRSWSLRAVDLARGDLLWEARGRNGDSPAFLLSTDDGVVVVANRRSRNGREASAVVTGLDPASGARRWSRWLRDPVGESRHLTLLGADLDGDRLLLAGVVLRNRDNRLDQLVQARDVETGALLWQEQQRPWERGSAIPRGVAVAGGRVVVAADVQRLAPEGGVDVETPVLRAYDPATGVPAWADEPFSGRVVALASAGTAAGLVYALLEELRSDSRQTRRWVLRAYDAAAGTVAWERRFQLPPPRRLVAAEGTLSLIGPTGSPASDRRLLLHAYDAADGTLVGRHRSRRGVLSDLRAAIARDGVLYAVGDGHPPR